MPLHDVLVSALRRIETAAERSKRAHTTHMHKLTPVERECEGARSLARKKILNKYRTLEFKIKRED